MILSMENLFEENDYFWSRYNGGWMKYITGLDKSKKDGFSLLGDFIDAGRTKNDYKSGLYLNCNIDGSRKNQEKIIQLLKLTDDGNLILLQEEKNLGRTWAVEFWENIEENLEEKVKLSVNEIINLIHDNLNNEQIKELSGKLDGNRNSPIKVNIGSFSKIERIDDEVNQVINDENIDFNKLSYQKKSEVLGLAIIKSWESLYTFNDNDIDLEFIKEGHIRKGDVLGYTLYVSDMVDGFAKVSDGRISLKLLY